MKLSKKSWHSWVYQFFYGFDNDMPGNLCPYFWKLVLALILFIPCFIIQLPTMIGESIFNRSGGRNNNDYVYRQGVFSTELNPVILGLFVNVMLFFIVGMVGMWFNLSGDNALFVGGVIGWVIALVTFFVWAKQEDKWHEWFSRKHDGEVGGVVATIEKRPNILTEFIKAKYNKYCPKIDWKK